MEPNEIKILIEKQGIAVEELRKSAENNEKLSQGKLDQIKADFTAGEEANQKLQKQMDDQAKKAEEQAEIIKGMEKQFSRFPEGTKDAEKQEQLKSFDRYLKEFPKEEKRFVFDDLDVKYLRTDLAENGGVLLPEILFAELLKEEVEVSPILENSRVINSKVKSLTVSRRITTGGKPITPGVNRSGEGVTGTKSDMNYKSIRLEAYKNDVVIEITREQLNFAAYNMRQEMMEDTALALTQQTNIDYLLGDGVSKSEGLLVNSQVNTLNSGIANNIDLDNFYEIQKKDNIKGVYRNNGKFYMNANTLFDLLQRKTGTGEYVWANNIALGLPNTLAGRPYVDTPDMPDVGANNIPVFFGDLKRAYFILRAVDVELIIDPYSSKGASIIEYMWIEFIGGKIALPEAIVKLKCVV